MIHDVDLILPVIELENHKQGLERFTKKEYSSYTETLVFEESRRMVKDTHFSDLMGQIILIVIPCGIFFLFSKALGIIMFFVLMVLLIFMWAAGQDRDDVDNFPKVRPLLDKALKAYRYGKFKDSLNYLLKAYELSNRNKYILYDLVAYSNCIYEYDIALKYGAVYTNGSLAFLKAMSNAYFVRENYSKALEYALNYPSWYVDENFEEYDTEIALIQFHIKDYSAALRWAKGFHQSHYYTDARKLMAYSYYNMKNYNRCVQVLSDYFHNCKSYKYEEGDMILVMALAYLKKEKRNVKKTRKWLEVLWEDNYFPKEIIVDDEEKLDAFIESMVEHEEA